MRVMQRCPLGTWMIGRVLACTVRVSVRYVSVESVIGSRMFRCQLCQAGYLDPRPTPNTIGLAYASYYTHGGEPSPRSDGRPRAGHRGIQTGIGSGY